MKPVQLGRRRLLFGRAAVREPLLPPWSRPLTHFLDACTRCDRCVDACPTRIIDAGGLLPVIDFTRGECTFCGDCVRACGEPAFDRDAFDRQAVPWTLVATIDDACLARKKVVCQSCGDVCEPRAIRFRPALGGVPLPTLDHRTCTGCGACVSVCPAGAVSVAATSTTIAAAPPSGSAARSVQ